MASSTITGNTLVGTFAVVDDLTPQLGGNLDLNSKSITAPSATISDFLDDDTMATASATTGATSESIKAYVDANSGGTAATQAEQETGTSTTVFVSPGRQQYHTSAAKVWINFDGTGTIAIRDSYNVTSITDRAVGNYTVTFDVDFAAADYSATIGAERPSGLGMNGLFSYLVGSIEPVTGSSTGVAQDYPTVCVTAHGDQ